jgi:hypothetical protein
MENKSQDKNKFEFNRGMVSVAIDEAKKCEHDNELVNTLRFLMSKNPNILDNSLRIAKLLNDMDIIVKKN